MAETAVNFLMENLKQLINCKTGLISQEKDQIESLYEELGLLRTFLKDREEKFYNHEELKNLEARIRELAYETKNTIDLFTVNPNPSPNPNSILEEEITIKKKKKDIGMTEKIRNVLDFMVLKKKAKKKDNGMAEKIGHVFDRSLNLDHVKQQIEAIKTDVMEICGKNIHDVGAIKVQTCSTGDSSTANSPTWEEETMVGFDEEATTIKEQLTGGPKQLEVLSIVGMPGLGKTTLAKKVYNDPYVRYYFYIRAWVNVSQDYRKRDLLIGLLSSVIERKDGIDRMSDEKLTEKLYKALKGRIYFIVMDDIWDNRAWVDVKSCFPNDSNGSRIMFTSRIADVALHGKSNSPPLSLRFLTHDESWDLLQQKVFRRETCPPQLIDIGKQIARKCQGLPLAIVVLAGVLANEEKRQDRWKQVGETINSYIAGDSQLCMETLALSYNHLPHHLKQCFLYFGAFREDFEIPVQKLIWLWVAERFIGKIDGKSLEDVAEEYLTDLIGRSLVLVSKRRSDGGIKACGIHDLLRDFCLKKAEEEYFLKHISDRQHFPSSGSTSKHFSCMRRLCIHPAILCNTYLIPSALQTRSFLCIAPGYTELPPPEFLSRCFKLLTVLDISSIEISMYPNEIEQLVGLRYLALGILSGYYMCYLPASISKLKNLETLLLCSSFSSVMLPHSIRKMVKLRHLCLRGPRGCSIERQLFDGGYPFSLDNLQTLSCADPFSWLDLLAGTPNLRKLGFRGRILYGGGLRFPDIHFLSHLQTLKLCNTDNVTSNCSTELKRIKFPPNLKKLTLEKTYLKWDEMSTLGKLLPNLEVLKLLSDACSGQRWEMGDEEFPRLKFLKLDSVQIMEWEVYSNHLPSLQRLVLVDCHGLEKIPSEIGEIPTLQMIEIHWCSPSIVNSAREIKEEQESIGNNWLQIIESNISDLTANIETVDIEDQ